MLTFLFEVDEDGESTDGDGAGGGRDGGTMRSGAGGSGRFTWKTLEEETRELMKQLERLRLQEVTKVKAVMVRAKEEHAKNLLKADKKKAVLTGQVLITAIKQLIN